MQQPQSDIQILLDLGLTLLQSKVYLALAGSGPANANTISKLAKVARPDVYRTLSKLHDFGLVEEIIETPRQYEAIPIAKGLTFLLNRKTQEHDMLKKNTELVLRTLKKKNIEKSIPGRRNKFVMIPKRERVVNRIRKAIDQSQVSIDLVLSLKRFLFGITDAFVENCERALARGVQFRIIVEKPEEANSAEIVAQFCRKNPQCNIRFLLNHKRTVFGIYDSKEAFIVVHPGEGLFHSPALYSNNECLLTMAKDYFEILWLTANKTLNLYV